MLIPKEPSFSFFNTVKGHGWFQLAPFEFDEARKSLTFTFENCGVVHDVSITETPKSLKIEMPEKNPVYNETALACAKHVLRLDEPFDEFHQNVGKDKSYKWIRDGGYGPLLRSPTVFEDLVKTICTTNCSWSLTKTMVSNLVAKLGADSASGKKAFPTPERIAGVTEAFLSAEIRAGYRGPYLLELAKAAATGCIQPENWLDSDLSSEDLKKEIKRVKGAGDYAAEHMLKLLGRYDGLALDSFLRSEFYKNYNRGKRCSDRRIEKHYSRFGHWKGLVIWFDMVEKRAVSRARPDDAGRK